MENAILCGDALSMLKTLESESVDLVITSPPYYGLRNYGMDGQIGIERTPHEYISKLMEIFNECKRVLKKTGSCWVNIGDSYDKNKSLVGIPERFCLAMQDNDWIRRNTIIWHKPNCMPSSAKDRFTVDFEYFYFFVKSQKKYYVETQYEPLISRKDRKGNNKKSSGNSSPVLNGRWGFYDYEKGRLKRCVWTIPSEKYYVETQYEPQSMDSIKRARRGMSDKHKWINGASGQTPHSMSQARTNDKTRQVSETRLKRCVWSITTKPFSGAHFAVFPEKLIETPIRACSPVNGIVLDPFMGSGTTGLVAKKLGRQYLGIELNPDYIKIAQKRIQSIL